MRKNLFDDIKIATDGKWNLENFLPVAQLKMLLAGTGDKFKAKVAENVLLFISRAMKRRLQV